MIQLVDQAIEQFLRTSVPLPEANVDISFEAPDKTWGASVTRPTINVFLWDIARNTALTQTGLVPQRAPDGQVTRQQAPVVIDLRYLITAWATENRDEHELLGAVLRCVLANPVLPSDAGSDLPEDVGTVRITLAAADRKMPDFRSALDGRVKPGLEVELTMAINPFAAILAGPPVTTTDVGVAVIQAPEAAEAADAVGATTYRRSRRNGRMITEGHAGTAIEANATTGGSGAATGDAPAED